MSQPPGSNSQNIISCIANKISWRHMARGYTKYWSRSGIVRDRGGGAAGAAGVEGRFRDCTSGTDEVPATLAPPEAAAAGLDTACPTGVEGLLFSAAEPASRAASDLVFFHALIESIRLDFCAPRRDSAQLLFTARWKQQCRSVESCGPFLGIATSAGYLGRPRRSALRAGQQSYRSPPPRASTGYPIGH
jgi:hypothetical protein